MLVNDDLDRVVAEILGLIDDRRSADEERNSRA